MRILFTICGRAGSKGIKNKNIKNFVGKPLPYYSLSAIDLWLKQTDISVEYDIVVNSDSQELLAMMEQNGKLTVERIEREESLAGGTIGKIDVIADCINRMEARKGYTYDLVVDLDITSPLRKAQDLEHVIQTHLEKQPDVTTTVASARRNPYFNQVKRTEKGFAKVIESNYTARQQAPEIYDMNASIYAYKPDFLRSGKGIFAGVMECVEMYDTGILDLDHENDFALMEVIAKFLFETEADFGAVYQNI